MLARSDLRRVLLILGETTVDGTTILYLHHLRGPIGARVAARTVASPLLELPGGSRLGVEHQARGALGGLERQGGKHTGVGVGGEHDAGMPEHGLHGLEVIAGGQREGGGAVAQVVQPDRGKPPTGLPTRRSVG